MYVTLSKLHYQDRNYVSRSMIMKKKYGRIGQKSMNIVYLRSNNAKYRKYNKLFMERWLHKNTLKFNNSCIIPKRQIGVKLLQ